MKRNLGAALVAAMLATPQDRTSYTTPPGLPRNRPNGMRKATVRPWNDHENARRRRQIERGVLRPTEAP